MADAAGVRYAEVPVHPTLSPYVQLIWTLDVDLPASFGAAERIVPDGIVEAIFHYRTPFNMRYGLAPFSRQPTSLVVSQTRSFIEIEPAGASGFISVRFHPWGACHFFQPPVSAFANQMVTAADLWDKEAVILEERIATANSTRERVRAVERFDRAALAISEGLGGVVDSPMPRELWPRPCDDTVPGHWGVRAQP